MVFDSCPMVRQQKSATLAPQTANHPKQTALQHNRFAEMVYVAPVPAKHRLHRERAGDSPAGKPALQLRRMAEKLIGSLIYGEHEIPKKSRTWQQALKVPVTIGLVLIFIGGLAYKFANFREEGRVQLFIEAIRKAQYDVAYQHWDADARYTMNDFLQDWGKDGYYTKGMHYARVTDSSGKGSSVVVYVTIDSLKYPVALRVDKETLKISFSPISKYPSP